MNRVQCLLALTTLLLVPLPALNAREPKSQTGTTRALLSMDRDWRFHLGDIDGLNAAK